MTQSDRAAQQKLQRSTLGAHDEAVELLRQQGYRLTPQRLLVLSMVVDGTGHMGVDEIYRRAKEGYPYMDIATVYRTLHLFKQLGLVTEVAIGDRLHYELTDPNGRHHHMVCQVCNGAYNLSPSYLEAFQRTLIEEFGFEPDLEHFAITGICSSCRSQKASLEGDP
jgi:Fur family ferric uptake transcriptional regulator